LAVEAQHLAQYEHNVAVAGRLASSGDFDWAVTALFYAALQLAQAYLVRSNVVVQSHAQRQRLMGSTDELRGVLDSYRTLRDYSEHARYECRSYTRGEFEAVQRAQFIPFVRHVQALLGVAR
jgi:HEPN domain-containing protein